MTTAGELHKRGVAALNTRRYPVAASLLRRAAVAAVAAEDADRHARVIASQAFLDYETGSIEDAFASLERALAGDGLSGDTRGVLQCQHAMLLLRHGETAAALEAFESGIRRLEDPVELARALVNRGGVRLAQGQPREASTDFERALTLMTAAGRTDEAVAARHNLGYASFLVGDLVAALGHMDASRERMSAMSPVMAATAAQDRAEVLLAAGLVSLGRRDLAAAATDFGRHRLGQRRAEAELALARTVVVSDPAAALRAARTASRRFARVGAESWRVRADSVALVAAVRTGRPGRSFVQRADELEAGLRAQGLTWGAHSLHLTATLGQVRQGDVADARRRLRDARLPRRAPLAVRLLDRETRAELAAAQGQRAAAFGHLRAGLEELHAWQSSFGSLDLQTNVAGHGVRLGTRGLALAVESGRPATLFEWSERARMLASRVQPVRAPQNPEIVAGLAELRDGVTQAREAELRGRIRELAWRSDGSREVMDPVSLEELQGALGDETALVAYVVTSDRLVALVVTAARIGWHDLGPRSALDALLGGLLPDLDMAASELPDPIGPVVRGGLVGRLQQLAGLLVAPLTGDLGDRAVVLTPSGVLAGIPWTVLPGFAGRPVTVAQSATTWLARAASPLRTASAGLVAGPRVARAEDEVTASAKEWPAATVLTNSAATAEAVSALAASVDVLHVAAHGQHSAENPLFSGLQLHDGLWFGYDIDQLSSVPDVVLLSACEVGRSTVRWGEELIGMATAWLHAGARCVIASPAAVADQAAYDALVAVHRGLANGLAPAAALAAAVPAPTAERPPVPFICFG
ncbi:CHAT domain-containing protein [Nocardioides panacihumi]|uniref:CHAT domain-containing protein n=1 Tax=Nocardioides panacihumi TaxID=400774 RepID=A0ABP5BWE9_9ACTN